MGVTNTPWTQRTHHGDFVHGVLCPASSGTLNKTMLFLSKAEYILFFAACEDKQPGSNLVFST